MDREHRVRRRDDFERVRRTGRRLAHPLLRLNWAPNTLERTRFGFVVGRKVATLAHERNRVRRRLRELARRALPLLLDGVDVVVIAQPAARDAPFGPLEQAFDQLCRRANLRRPGGGPGR